MDASYRFIYDANQQHGVEPRRVEFTLDGKVHDHSALTFINMNDASVEIEKLKSLSDCPYMAKGFYPCQNISNLGTAIALIEPVMSLETWLKKNEKNESLCFWNYNADETKCIGIGKDFIIIAFQIAQALEKIHKAKMFHGSLSCGVMITEDNQARICNFLPDKEGIFVEKDYAVGQKRDLMEFMSVLQKIARVHPPKNGLTIPFELTWYYSLSHSVSPVPRTFRDFEEISRWIYHSPIYWKSAKKLFFYDALYQILNLNGAFFTEKRFLRPFQRWRRTLRKANDSTLDECVDFGSRYYGKPFGIIPFIKNYKKHHKGTRSEAEAAEYVTNFFPNFLEITYTEVLRLKDEPVHFSAGKLETLGTLIWKEPSVFNMDACRS